MIAEEESDAKYADELKLQIKNARKQQKLFPNNPSGLAGSPTLSKKKKKSKKEGKSRRGPSAAAAKQRKHRRKTKGNSDLPTNYLQSNPT